MLNPKIMKQEELKKKLDDLWQQVSELYFDEYVDAASALGVCLKHAQNSLYDARVFVYQYES